MNEDNDPNPPDSNHGVITNRDSIASHESLPRLPNNHPSKQSLSENYSGTSISELVNQESTSTKNVYSRSNLEQINEDSSDTKLYSSINTNAVVGNHYPLVPAKRRRYTITVTHSDAFSNSSSDNNSITTKVLFSFSLRKFFVLSYSRSNYLQLRLKLSHLK